MKHYLPQIAWHDRDVIYSVDFQNTGDPQQYALLTAGMQKELRKWEIRFDATNSLEVNYVCQIRGHQEPINVARFSPDGRYIASGENKGQTFVWEKTESEAPDIFGDTNDENYIPDKENWQKLRTFRDQHDDISDLAWAADSVTLYSVSVDCSCAIHNVQTGQRLKLIVDHGQFVNGVCCDPRSRLFATLSNDRSMRVYAMDHPKFKALKKVQRAKFPVPDHWEGKEAGETLDLKLFHDDQLNSFVRRPAFSPCGELLVVPAGNLDIGTQSINCSYVFTRKQYDSPVAVLPCPDKPTIAVAFSPVFYKLNDDVDTNSTGLPYRCVFAVVSLHSLAIYDTQQCVPLAYITNVHYAPLTDAAWSNDGRLLVFSSQDGYNSFLRFEPDELGQALEGRPQPPATPPPVVKEKPVKRPKSPAVSTIGTGTPAAGSTDPTTNTPPASADRTPKRKTPSSKNIKALFAAAAAASGGRRKSTTTAAAPSPSTPSAPLPAGSKSPSAAGATAPPESGKKQPRRITLDSFLTAGKATTTPTAPSSSSSAAKPDDDDDECQVIEDVPVPPKETAGSEVDTETSTAEKKSDDTDKSDATAKTAVVDGDAASSKAPRRVAFMTL